MHFVLLSVFISHLIITICGQDLDDNSTFPEYPEGGSDEILQPRIANGRSVHPGDVPYHIQLRIDDKYHCGAALIISEHGNQVVLTAAQCVTKKSPSKDFFPFNKMTLVGGRVKRDGVHSSEQVRSPTKINRHPQWKRTYSLDYEDLAVIHLNRPFNLNRLVQPLALIETTTHVSSGEVIISGWGYTDPAEESYADELQISIIDVIPQAECRDRYEWEITAELPDSIFCAGKKGSTVYQGACYGDVGGPAALVDNYTLYLAGIFDWGKPRCGNRYQPSIFTDLTYFVKWIQDNSKPS